MRQVRSLQTKNCFFLVLLKLSIKFIEDKLDLHFIISDQTITINSSTVLNKQETEKNHFNNI